MIEGNELIAALADDRSMATKRARGARRSCSSTEPELTPGSRVEASDE
jgi:hypothetical protein